MAKRNTDGVVEVMGLDLGDRWSQYSVVEACSGQEVRSGRVATSRRGLKNFLGRVGRMRVVIEVGTHSPWVKRLLEGLGHEVVVANARRVQLITAHSRKSDQVDARFLARLGRLDVELLSPIEHRSEELQVDLAVVRSRDALVRSRTQLINHVRGTVKAMGERLGGWSAASFAGRALEVLPEPLRPALAPLVVQIGALSAAIRDYDRQIEELIEQRYPEAQGLRAVGGVGPITALTFVLTLGRAERFSRSRTVGAYLGLVPRRDQSGSSDPQLRITKEGDGYLRQLLVQCAHYILGPFGRDSDLRRAGERIAASGSKNAKKRAVVAVARKLAVLLHHLWVSGDRYEPLYQSQRLEKQEALA